MIEHWTTEYLRGANASFQRAAREYAEAYAALAVAEELERCQYLCRTMSFEFFSGSKEREALQDAATRMGMDEHGGMGPNVR